jgi:hypothetical protein
VSNVDDLRKKLFYFSAFSGITVFYVAAALDSSLHWVTRTLFLVGAVSMSYFALLEYRDLIELYEEEADSDDSSSGREVIQVEVDESP